MTATKLVLVHDATGDRITVDEIFHHNVVVKHLGDAGFCAVSWWVDHGWRLTEEES